MKAWPPPKEKWFPGFTAHRDGWVRSYKGKTIACGGKRATRDEVERTFAVKRDRMDEGAALSGPVEMTYKVLLSHFLDAMQHRVETGKPYPLSERTLHNYAVELNDFGAFVGGNSLVRDVNRPDVFAAYARRFGKWKASGYDSIVSRVGALFRWAEEMEYIDRYRPGPGFQRPAKADLRDDRLDLSKSYTPSEVAKLYHSANHALRCLLGMGMAAAMNNSEVSNLPRSCIDLESGVIDFRRRKTGRARRVCPLPAEVVDDLKAYCRPDPIHDADADLFFLTEYGNPYSTTRKRDGKPSDSLSRLFRELETEAGVGHKEGRNFSGLRTTWFNLFQQVPHRGDYDTEQRIIMGRAHGTIDFDNYLEDVGLDRLRHVSAQVWSVVSTALADEAVRRAAMISLPESSEARSGRGGSPPQLQIVSL